LWKRAIYRRNEAKWSLWKRAIYLCNEAERSGKRSERAVTFHERLSVYTENKNVAANVATFVKPRAAGAQYP
jgi:hypothetical protein